MVTTELFNKTFGHGQTLISLFKCHPSTPKFDYMGPQYNSSKYSTIKKGTHKTIFTTI